MALQPTMPPPLRVGDLATERLNVRRTDDGYINRARVDSFGWSHDG